MDVDSSSKNNDESDGESVLSFQDGGGPSESSSEDEQNAEEDIKDELKSWAVEFNITQNALSNLLKILKQHHCHSHLPADARTLMRTPKTVETKTVEPGNYVHLGFESG